MDIALELDPKVGRHCGTCKVLEGHLGRNHLEPLPGCGAVVCSLTRPNLTRRSEWIEHTACVLFNFEKVQEICNYLNTHIHTHARTCTPTHIHIHPWLSLGIWSS